MLYVHTTQIINDTADLYCVLNPLLEGLKLETRGKYAKRGLEKILDEAREKAEEKKFQARFEKHILSNESILNCLKEKNLETVIFLTSVSADKSSGVPKRLATDPLQDSFLLTTRILEMAEQLPEAYENVLLVPVAPVIFPCIFGEYKTKKAFGIGHAFPEQIESITQNMEAKGKQGFGSLYKTLHTTGNIPNYQFAEAMFDFEKARNNLAKRNCPFDESVLGYTACLNNVLLAEAYKTIAEIMGIRQIHIFAMRGSYAFAAMKRVSEEICIQLHPIGFPQLFSMKEAIFEGEAHPSAISALHGFVKAIYDNRKGEASKVGKRRDWRLAPRIEFLNCPYKSFLLCSSQKRCDSRTEACALDHLKTMHEEEVSLLEDDCKKHNIGIYEGIEAVICRLLTEDFSVKVHGSRKVYSWKEEIKGALVKLNAFERVEEFKGDVRASSLNSKCLVARVIANMRDEIPVQRIGTDARIGTLTHAFMLNQYMGGMFLPNRTIEKVGLQTSARHSYCEKFVSFNLDNILITGHLDSSILIHKPKESWVGIIDLKHLMQLPHIGLGHRYQLLSYAKGLGYENAYLILVNTAFRKPGEEVVQKFTNIGRYNKQEISILKVGKDSRIHLDLKKEITKTNYAVKNISRELLHEIIHSNRKTKQGLEQCNNCLEETNLCCDWLLDKYRVKKE